MLILKKEQFVTNVVMRNAFTENSYRQFKPIMLTFNQAAKLVNDSQFTNVFKMWKSYSQAVNQNKQTIYNKF